jgi:hypothetical protein
VLCNGACTDFPSDPIIDAGAPTGSPGIFGAAGSGSATGGPCLLEPVIGALFPANWLRPRFRVAAPAGQDVFEIRLHVANQANDLVVYTDSTWTMPKSMWTALASHSRDMPITVTVRGASKAGGGVAVGTSGDIRIAPVGASGTMVYWSTSGSTNGTPSNDNTLLSGFAVGDESVVQVLTPDQAMNKPMVSPGTDGQQHHCIGCHTSTPDGLYISYNDFFPWSLVLASGKPDIAGGVGASPTFLKGGGFRAISQPWTGISTYSPAHWMDHDHLAVAPLGTTMNDGDQQPGLAWFDLENTSIASTPDQLQADGAWGWIYQAAPNAYAGAPSWSHGGSNVVFTMTSNVVSGRLGTGSAHLVSVPFAKTPGAPVTPLPISDAATSADYYGSLSHDDKLIAFNRVPAATAAMTHKQLDGSKLPWDGMYMQPDTQVFVAPVDGSISAHRLAANDPPKCSGVTSPGINNTWAKWSPEVQQAGGKTYYWLIFSSWREGKLAASGSPIAQLYVAGVVLDETGLSSFPAIYLWNQRADISNHTPAWDVFQIPAVP